MKRLLALLTFCVVATFGQSPVTVTGTIQDPAGNLATSGYVQFNIQPSAQGVQFFVNGTTTLAPTSGQCGINGSGQVKNLALSGPCQVWGNDVISPGNTAYKVTFAPNGTVSNVINNESITGTTYSLNSPVFNNNVKIVPQYQTITTNPISVNLTPAANNVFDVGAPGLQYAAGYFGTLFGNVSTTSNAAIKPAASGAVQYVSINGNDANDGLSMGSAKGNIDLGTAVAAAETAIGSGPGQIFILPANYTSTTAIKCASDISIFAFGASVTYSGTSQAVLCANVTRAHILGGKFFGPSSSGSTIGLQLGIGSGGSGVVTQYDSVSDVYIKGFGTGVKIEGSASNNGTFENSLERVQADTNGVGWDIRPTVANQANANRFFSDLAIGNTGDGWKIDGANGNVFLGVRAEGNGGFGWNFPGVSVTQFNSFFGTWGESNTSGDFNSGSATNVTETRIEGGTLNSTPNFAGSWTGGGNVLQIQAKRDWYLNAGNPAVFHIGSVFGNNLEPLLENDDTSPPSGLTAVIGYNRTGANAGSLFLGTPEFPVTFRSSGGGTITHQAPNTAGTFTITDPAATGNAVVDTATQTLTNKTLSGAKVDSATGMQYLSSGGGTVSVVAPSTSSAYTVTLPAGAGTLSTIPTMTLKSGGGAGNYTTASTTYVVVDSTHLCYTVTIPTGFKLGIDVNGNLGTSTAVVAATVGLSDNASCSTANSGIFTETQVFSNAAGNTESFGLTYVITGDGNAHNIALQFKTANAADSALMLNSSSTLSPTMKFTLTQSN